MLVGLFHPHSDSPKIRLPALHLLMLSKQMKQALLIVDVQPSFSPPKWLVEKTSKLSSLMPSIATVERHKEDVVPFIAQLDWAPGPEDRSLVEADYEFAKHGYGPTEEILSALIALKAERILVCGIQADTCVLAAGFALIDLGLRPTLIRDLVVGSSLDRSGKLGEDLWRHHFREVTDYDACLQSLIE